MKVSLVGQTRWIELLSRLLNEHGGEGVEACAFPDRTAIRLLNPGHHADVLLRVGYRPGASTPRGVAFDAWWSLVERVRPRIPTVYYWIGTDLFNTVADAEAGRLRQPFHRAARRSTHVAAAPWFVHDLGRLGMEATVALFPTPLPTMARPSSLPSQFSVLTYIPAGRSHHYGGDAVMQVARAMREVPFRVVGSDGRPIAQAPRNVESIPKQPNLDQSYRDSTVVLRIVRHDAVGATVREGLVHARHVIYSYPLPFVQHVPYDNPAVLRARLEMLRAEHDAGRLSLNIEGRDYALAEFDVARLVQRLASAVTHAKSV